jgi:hypothetical protein
MHNVLAMLEIFIYFLRIAQVPNSVQYEKNIFFDIQDI